MKPFRHSSTERTSPPTTDPGADPGRLGGVRPVFHDEDDRPSREDRDYGQTIFTRPAVPLPRLLTGGRRERRR